MDGTISKLYLRKINVVLAPMSTMSRTLKHLICSINNQVQASLAELLKGVNADILGILDTEEHIQMYGHLVCPK